MFIGYCWRMKSLLEEFAAQRLNADVKIVAEVIRRTLILRGYRVTDRPYEVSVRGDGVYEVRFGFVVERG